MTARPETPAPREPPAVPRRFVVGSEHKGKRLDLVLSAQAGDVSNKGAMKVFHGSISYLTLLFIALAVDPFIGSAVVG